jgi:hypothetical protein
VSHLGGLVVVGVVEDFELDDEVEVVNVVMLDDVVLDDVEVELVLELLDVEDVLLDELVVATEVELLDELVLLVVELVLLVVELVLLVVELVLLVVELVLLVVELVLLVAEELLDELVLEVLVVELVTGLPPTAIRLLPEMTYTRLLPNIGRWNFARPTVPGTLVIGSSTPLVGTARKADNPLLVSAIQT